MPEGSFAAPGRFGDPDAFEAGVRERLAGRGPFVHEAETPVVAGEV